MGRFHAFVYFYTKSIALKEIKKINEFSDGGTEEESVIYFRYRTTAIQSSSTQLKYKRNPIFKFGKQFTA